jgi:hypothetical protein
MKANRVILALQLLIIAIFVLGDIGFDFPGAFGLDYDHFIILAGIYLLLFVVGFIRSIKRAETKWMLAQIAGPFAILIYMASFPLLYHRPLDAAEYQHLVGKSRADVRAALGRQESTGSGSGGDAGGPYDFESYNGMEIHYSPDGRVRSIEAKPID